MYPSQIWLICETKVVDQYLIWFEFIIFVIAHASFKNMFLLFWLISSVLRHVAEESDRETSAVLSSTVQRWILILYLYKIFFSSFIIQSPCHLKYMVQGSILFRFLTVNATRRGNHKEEKNVILNLVLSGTLETGVRWIIFIGVINGKPPCKDGYARFTTVPLKPLSDL